MGNNLITFKLLAVDLGLRTGYALYGFDGRLCWCCSRNFGAITRLRRAVPGILHNIEGLNTVVVEGDRALGEIWRRTCERMEAQFISVQAEQWRDTILYQREWRNSLDAKQNAKKIARKIISWSEIPQPKKLRHDAAEAILIGMWGVLKKGWLKRIPSLIH